MALADQLGAVDPQGIVNDLISQHEPGLVQNGAVDPQSVLNRLIRREQGKQEQERQQQAPQKPAQQPVDFSAFGRTEEEADAVPPVDFAQFGTEESEAGKKKPADWSVAQGAGVFARSAGQAAVKSVGAAAKSAAAFPELGANPYDQLKPEQLGEAANPDYPAASAPYRKEVRSRERQQAANRAAAQESIDTARAVPVEERAPYKAGKAIQEWADKNIQVTPQERKTYPITSQAGGMIGGAIPAVGAAVAGTALGQPALGLAAAGGIMAAQSAGDEFDRARTSIDEQIAAARKAGDDAQAKKLAETKDDVAAHAAGLSAIVNGTMGVLPVGVILAPVKEIAPGLTGRLWAMLDHAWKSGVTFTGIGEAQQYIGEQLAKQYDPKAEYHFDYQRLVAEFLAGGALGAGHAAFQKRPGETRIDTEDDTRTRDDGRPRDLPPPLPGDAGADTGTTPPPFKTTMRPKLRTTLEEKAAYYKEHSAEDIASWSDEKLKEYVNVKGGMGMAPDEDVLRRAGHTDEDIKGMSPEEKQSAVKEAKDYGVHAGEEPPQEGSREAPVKPQTAEETARAAEAADADHTPAQGEAGNAKRGHMVVLGDGDGRSGLGVTIEAKKGGMRRGTAPDGTPFETQVGAHYGYFKGLPKAADGQDPDVFVGDHPTSPVAFVIDELDPKTGKYRQSKSFVHFQTFDQALDAYLGTSSKDSSHVGGMKAYPVEAFKEMARAGGLSKPVAQEETKPGAGAEKPDSAEVAQETTPPPPVTTDHIDAVDEAVRASGIDPAQVDHSDIAHAAEIHAREGVPPDEAFLTAVVRGLVKDGHVEADAVRGAVGAEAANEIIGYHASPHEFEAFDLSKVGTGEGAQRYGHGAYVAENAAVSGVGGEYHKAFAKQRVAQGDSGLPADNPFRDVQVLEPDLSTAFSYRVRIKANKDHFLDWDKPLHEQSEHVQKALKGIEKKVKIDRAAGLVNDAKRATLARLNDAGTTGDKLYGSLQFIFDDKKKASDFLLGLGVPGIKYLDQGSRGAGAGTRNFVVFDDKKIEITHKNGEPVSKAEHAKWVKQHEGPEVLDTVGGAGGRASPEKDGAATGRPAPEAAPGVGARGGEDRGETRRAEDGHKTDGGEHKTPAASGPAGGRSTVGPAAGGERTAAARPGGERAGGRAGQHDRQDGGQAAGAALIGEPVKSLPEHNVTGADNKAVRVRPVVVEAADLITSWNPGYLKALQPRQRDRAASQAQIREIATRLDPERLGYSAEADRGAPIVGPDRMVESGNGRVAALKALYRGKQPNADKYREWLKGQGVDVAKFKEPVLVRQRVTDLEPHERIAFTVAANQSATLSMSAPERAMADARHLTPQMLSTIEDAGNLGAAGNRGFVRAFVAAIPASERGAVTAAGGALSAEGLTRARNAVLARAYGDADVLARIMESTDDDIRSISNALVMAAPQWAKLIADIDEGRVRADLDTTPELMAAVKHTADIRGRGQKLEDYLRQEDAFDRLPGPVETFMRMFYDPAGRRASGAPRIADALRFYAEQAAKVSTDPRFDLGAPEATADEIQRAALAKKTKDELQGAPGAGARHGAGGEQAREEARGPRAGAGVEGADGRGERGDGVRIGLAESDNALRPAAEGGTGRADVAREAVGKMFDALEKGPKNQWFTVPEGRIYARTAMRPELGGKVFDIANVRFEEEARGKGAFTDYLHAIEAEATARGYAAVHVEQLENERLNSFLQREGYERVPGFTGEPSLYKELSSKPKSMLETAKEGLRFGSKKAEALRRAREIAERVRSKIGLAEPAGPFDEQQPRIVSSPKMQEAVLRNAWVSHGRDLDYDDVWQTNRGNALWEREVAAWNKKHGTDIDAENTPFNSSTREFTDYFDKKYLAGKKQPFPGVEEANEFFENNDLIEHAAYVKGDVPEGFAEGSDLFRAEPGVEGKPQGVIHGAERISPAELARRRAAAPLKPRVAQKVAEGLFGETAEQGDLLKTAKVAPTVAGKEEAAHGREAVREGPSQVPQGKSARRAQRTASGRPDQLSLFGGETGAGAVRKPARPDEQQARGAEPAVPPEGLGVSKPPAVGGRDRAGKRDPSADRGLRVAREKIAERSRLNYRITDEDHIGEGGPKQKVRGNLDAIRVLKTIEDENRQATPAEKAQLVKYVGWGAFAQDVFASHKPEWKAEREALRSLLTESEYDAAKGSTLNAHFTSPDVIRGMWDALDHLGFKGGLALEPSSGAGHFIGLIPDKFAPKTAWTATELDPITGRIAHALYAGAEMHVQGFEELKRPSNYYDLAISNVPFGDYNISEKPYGAFPIHDFFFVKSLDKVRPGGVVAFITSRYTMDRADSGTRRLLSKTADLVGAIRLPGGRKGAFAGNAGTEVTTDIIFLRKKVPGERPFNGENWLDTREITTPEGPVKINEYFARLPNMMLGEMRLIGSMYGKNEPVLSGDAEGIQDKIAQAASGYMEKGAMMPRGEPPAPALPTDETAVVKDGAFFMKGDKLYQRRTGQGFEQNLSADDHDRVKRLIGIRDTVNDLLAAQLTNAGDIGPKAALRKKLATAYDGFVRAHGPINLETATVTSRLNKAGEPVVITRQPNLAKFLPDPDVWKVAAIENYDRETGKAKPADIQTKDVIDAPKQREINAPADALATSLDQTGGVDLDHIAESLGLDSPEAAAATLGDLVYFNPDGRTWQTASSYLSGDVVKKLEEARAIAQDDKSYDRNVRALEKVQPTPLTRADITAQFGAPWVPEKAYADFFTDALGASNVKVRNVPVTGEWKVSIGHVLRDAQSKYATDRVSIDKIAQAAMNNQQITVWDTIRDGDGEKKVVNHPATEAARLRVESLKEAFSGDHETGIEGWVWRDNDRSKELEAIYNRTFNNLVPQKFDGSHLTFPGLNPMFADRQHRKDAVWRMVQRGNTLLAHVVGSGKTVTMIAGGMEMKRLGLINKPAYVIPNHMLEQFSREFIQAYPNAKILVAQKDEMTREHRKEFLAKVSANDWDGVIITHDAFGRINMNVEWRKDFVREQMNELARIMDAEKAEEGKNSPTIKALEKAKKRLQGKLEKLLNEDRKDEGTTFEESGIDHLFVDEAHKYRKLHFNTRMQRVKGLPQDGSQRAEDLFLKIRYLEQKRPGRSAVFATGTPVSNTMAELWIMQRYLQLEALRERGLDTFDNWAQTFGRVVNNMELSADGRSLKEVSSFSKFVNVPELISLYSEIADTKTADMLNLPTPQVRSPSGTPGIEIMEAQPSAAEEAYIQDLVKLAESLKGKRPLPGEPNILSVVTRGRKVATDGRLVGIDEINPRGKISLLVKNVHDIWKAGKEPGLVQVIFLDMGVPKTRAAAAKVKPAEADINADDIGVEGANAVPERINLYADIKSRLVAMGVPAKEIAAIHDATDDAKLAKMFARTRAGNVRVLIGSTEKMGVGTNVPDRLIAMHHVDAPWMPAEVEQRDGRIKRQGNRNPEVRILRYVTAKSFDAFMWQKLDTKSKFIGQVLSGAKGSRHAEDIDNPLPEAAEMKAAASGDPRILEHAELERQVRQFAAQKRAFEQTRSRADWEQKSATAAIELYEKELPTAKADAAKIEDIAGDKFKVMLGDQEVTKRAEAGKTILDRMLALNPSTFYAPKVVNVGTMSGFDMNIQVQSKWTADGAYLVGQPSLKSGTKGYGGNNDIAFNEQTDPAGIMRRFENILASIRQQPERLERTITTERDNLERIAKTLKETWPKEKEYRTAVAKLETLTSALRGDGNERQFLQSVLDAVNPDAMAHALAKRAANPALPPMADVRDVLDGLMASLADIRSRPSTASIMNTPERVALQESIAAKLYEQHGMARPRPDMPPRRAGRRVDIVLGPPAAGKSGYVVEPLMKAHGSVLLDADEAKALVPEFDGGLGAGAVHEESAFIAENLLASRAAAKGENIVQPMVGKNLKKIAQIITLYKRLGYSVHVHFVDLDIKKALGRALTRFVETGRLLDPGYIESIDHLPRKTFDELKGNPDVSSYHAISTDVPFGEPARVIESSGEPQAYHGVGGAGSGLRAEGARTGDEDQVSAGLAESPFRFLPKLTPEGAKAAAAWVRQNIAKAVEPASIRPWIASAVSGLINHVGQFNDPHVDKIIAHTVDNLAVSIKVTRDQAAEQLGNAVASLLEEREATHGVDDDVRQILGGFAEKRGPFTSTVDRVLAKAAATGPFQLLPKISAGKQAQFWVLDRGRLNGDEHLLAIGADGALIDQNRGTARFVEFTDKIKAAALDRNAAVVIHHNHPNDKTLSTQDVAMLGMPGIAAVWAHGHAGAVSRAALTPEARAAWRSYDHQNAVRKLYHIAEMIGEWAFRGVLQRAVDSKFITNDFGNGAYGHLINVVLARAGVIDYRSNVEMGSLIADLNLEPHIERAAQAVRSQVFRDARPAAYRDDRPPGPLQHPGDLGASFERAPPAAREHSAPAPDDGYGRARDRAQEARETARAGQLRLPGVAETRGPFGARAGTGGAGAGTPPPPGGGGPGGGAAGGAGAPAGPPSPNVGIRNRIAAAFESRLYSKIVEGTQDLSEPVRRLQADLEARRGVPFSDLQDFYTRKRLYPGRVGNEVRDFNREYLDPLVEHMKARQISLPEAGDYVYAKHVAERNARLGVLYPAGHPLHEAMTDPSIVGASGRSQAWANDVFARAARAGKTADFERIAAEIGRMRDFILGRMESGHLITPETAAAWRAQYQHYVDLRGFEDAPDEAPPDYREPSRFNVRGKEVKQAFGRQSKADNPIVNMLDQAYRTIDRAERNRYLHSVWNALVRMRAEDPSKLVDVVRLDKGKQKKVIDKNTGLVKYVDDSSYAGSPNTVTTKIAGEPHYMVFENRDIAEAIKRMVPESLGMFQGILNLENKLKSLWTHYSPDFLFRHFVFRYPIEGTLNSFEQKESGDHSVAKYIKNSFPFLGTSSRAIFAANKAERLSTPEGREMQDYWDEMRKAGGAMMFRQSRDMDMLREHLQTQLLALKGKPVATMRERWRRGIEAMDVVTNALDNSLRLSAYVSARKQGKSPQQSALIAREATVDFQKKGKWANGLGLIWPFANVAIQTGTRMTKALYRSKMMQRVFMSTFAMGFLTAAYNYLVGGNDKDGVPFFEKIPEWDRRLNFIIINPYDRDEKGRPMPIKIPMPYNWAFPLTMGHAMGTMVFGKEGVRKALSMVLRSGIEVLTPFGQNENMAATVTPELARPFVYISTNKDYAGRPVHINPEFQKAPNSWSGKKDIGERVRTGEGWKYIAKTANDLTGGSRTKSGVLDFYPEDYKLLFDYAYGSQSRTLQNIYQTGKSVVTGKSQEPDPTHVPLERVVRGVDYDAADRALRFERLEKQKHPWLNH